MRIRGLMIEGLMIDDASRLGHSKAQQGGAFIPSAQIEAELMSACRMNDDALLSHLLQQLRSCSMPSLSFDRP